MPFKRYFGPLEFYREVLAVALPVMIQQLIMSMVSLIDNFMVAGLGDLSMAAVNVANQLNFIFIVAVNAVCAAGGIYLAQFRGAENAAGMQHAFRFKALLGAGLAFVYITCCLTIPRQMIALMTWGNAAQEGIMGLGAAYLRLSSLTFLPMAFSMAIGSSFRETGKPMVPMYISAAATVVNTLGNWVLIYGNLGAPRLEIRGAAIATIIARLFEVTVFLIYGSRKKTAFFVKLKDIFKIDAPLVREILSKSGMLFLSEFSWVSSETIVTALYNGRGGAEVVAGMAAGWTIANLFFLLFGGIYTAAAVTIGGALGAGKLELARRRAVWMKSGSVVGGIVISVLGMGLALVLIPLVYSNLSPGARLITYGLVSVIVLYFPLWALLNAQFAISRAGGDTAMGMYADVSVNTLLFVPGAFLLANLTTLGPVPMFAILKASDVAKFLVARHFLKKERWVKNLAAGK